MRAKLSPQKEDASTPKPGTGVVNSCNYILEALDQGGDFFLGIQAEKVEGVTDVHGVTPLNLLYPMDDFRNYLTTVLGTGRASAWCSNRDAVLVKASKKFLPAVGVDNSKALQKLAGSFIGCLLF